MYEKPYGKWVVLLSVSDEQILSDPLHDLEAS